MADRRLTAALAGSAAASAAVAAPTDTALSFGDSPPWHWVVHTDSLDLYADRPASVTAADPGGRMLLLRGGGAVHRVRVALAADGLAAQASLLPDPDSEPDHLARITVGGRITVTAEARALYEATDPLRPLVWRGTPTLVVDDLVRAVTGTSGVALRLDSPLTRLPVPGGEVHAVLYGDDATERGWLHAGEALSAMVLAAHRHGLAVAADQPATNAGGESLRSLLTGIAMPYLTVRVSAP